MTWKPLHWSGTRKHAPSRCPHPEGYQPADDPAIYDELANLDDPGLVRFERYGITCTPVENDPSAEDFITAAAHNLDDESGPQS